MKLIKIKKFKSEVSSFLYDLRNKDYVRKKSLDKKKIKVRDHKRWIEKFFSRKNFIYVVLKKKKMIGYIRFEKIKSIYNVSWAIRKNFQKQGIIKNGLLKTTKNKNLKYKAIILENNKPSIKVAMYANFKLKYKRNNQYYLYK